MKTISQIAKEIGVSKQAVYDKIKKEPLLSSLKNLTLKLDGTLHYDIDGERLIKSAFNRNIQSSISSETSKDVDNNSQNLIDSLKDTIVILKRELDVKNNQIEDLRKLVEQAQTLAGNAQQLHATEKIPQLIEGEKKKGFFNIFSRKK